MGTRVEGEVPARTRSLGAITEGGGSLSLYADET